MVSRQCEIASGFLKIESQQFIDDARARLALREPVAGVRVAERVPCEVTPSVHAEEYLKTKKEKLGHIFTSS